MKLLLLLLMNCALMLSIKADDENPNKNLRLLFYSSKGLFFSKGYSHELYEKGNFNKSLRSISQGTRKDVKIVSIDYHPGKKMLYWTSPREGYWTRNPQLLSLKLNDNFFDAVRYTMRNTDIQILREDEYWNPRSLAVDYIGNKLYIADTSEKSIVVLNLDGTNKTTVFKGKSLIPFEVALDPPEGLMFILTANTEDGVSQIYRANMDGTEAELIVDNLHALRSFRVHEKTAFAIDTERKRILFGDLRNNNIESVNYSGEKCSNKSTIVGALHPHSLSVYKDFLYWSNDDPGILGCDESYSLKTCQLDKGSRIDIDYFCHSGYKKFQLGGISDFKSKVYAVKAINRYLHADIKVRNPCSRNNGGCNHHCLIKPSKNTKKSKLDTSCLCYQGYKLTDSKICEKDSEIYAYNQAYISASEEHQLLREDAVRLIYSSINMVYYKKPFRFFQVSEAGDNLLDVSIEPNDRYPYPLKDCSLKPNEKNFTLIHSKKKSIAKVITYDWITKNLYYIKLSGEKEKNDLMVLRYDNPTNSQRFRKQKMDSIELTKIYSPRFMVVHPYRSYLFVALDNNSTIRLNSDGSNGTILPNVNGAEMLAIDYDEDVLYWINIDYYATWASIFKDYVLWKANLDGSEPKRLLSLDWGILNVDNIFMYVSGDYIYLKSSIKPDGLAINKKTEEIIDDFKINIESLYQENVAVNVSIKSTEQRLNREKYHPCAINNGGCEKFCFSVPGKNELRQKKVCF